MELTIAQNSLELANTPVKWLIGFPQMETVKVITAPPYYPEGKFMKISIISLKRREKAILKY